MVVILAAKAKFLLRKISQNKTRHCRWKEEQYGHQNRTCDKYDK